MEQINNVSYVIMKSSDSNLVKVAARFVYKNLNREYYIFIKKNPKYTKGDYLREAKKKFEVDVKKGKIADHYMNKKPLVILTTVLGISAVTLAAVFTHYYLTKPNNNIITFDAGKDATIEIYDGKSVNFAPTSNITWDSFYKDHHYFGAIKPGYDFLYWSLDGKDPIPNDYLLDKSTHIVPVYHENTDGVSFILRHIPNDAPFRPGELPTIIYENYDSSFVPENFKVCKNYGEWETYDSSTSDTEFSQVGDVVSFKCLDSYSNNKFSNDEAEQIFAVSGDTKYLAGEKNIKKKLFFQHF